METKPHLLTDQELLVLLKKGHQEAFSVIYDRYWPLLLNHSRRMLSDDEEVRDVLQEVFSGLWKSAETLEINSSLSSYLYALTRNRVLNVIAHRKVRNMHVYSLAEFMQNGHVETDHLVRTREFARIIESEIAVLPKKMRLIFELSRKEHLSYKEISEKLSVSENTVKKQISNALKILRLRLGVAVFLIMLLNK